MKISTLRDVLNRTVPVAILKKEIKTEIEAYSKLNKERGKAIQIKLQEDTDYILNTTALTTLCNLFVENILNSQELAYIADSIQLSDRIIYKDERISGFLFEMTDPEINGPFTINRAKTIINEINI